MYEICCGEGGLSPQHFFYEMTAYEAEAYVRGVHRRGWEQARYIAEKLLLPLVKNPESFHLETFVWEKKQNSINPEQEEQDLTALRAHMDEWADFLSNKNKES